MISQLHGTLVEATMSSAVVDVSGVGFELGISGSTAATLATPGGEVCLYTPMPGGEAGMAVRPMPLIRLGGAAGTGLADGKAARTVYMIVWCMKKLKMYGRYNV